MFYIILIIIGVIFVLWFIRKHFKTLKIPNVYLISGSVKSGKSLLSVALAVKQYKKCLRKYKIKYILAFIFHKDKPEKPMLYSNMKLRYVKFNLLSNDVLFRNVRLPYGSVVLIDEASLVADSMLYANKHINERLTLFVKLFAHYTRGGYMFINTQSLKDLHFALKRCIGQYVYISDRTKLPLISVFNVREMLYSEDGDIVNTFGEDKDLSLRKVFIFNKYYKYYDCYCYSIFTDNKEVYVNYDVDVLGKHDSLKTDVLVSLQDFKELKEYKRKYESK